MSVLGNSVWTKMSPQEEHGHIQWPRPGTGQGFYARSDKNKCTRRKKRSKTPVHPPPDQGWALPLYLKATLSITRPICFVLKLVFHKGHKVRDDI